MHTHPFPAVHHELSHLGVGMSFHCQLLKEAGCLCHIALHPTARSQKLCKGVASVGVASFAGQLNEGGSCPHGTIPDIFVQVENGCSNLEQVFV